MDKSDDGKGLKRAGLILPELEINNNVEFSSNYKSEQIEELKEIYRMYDKTNVGYINDTVNLIRFRHSSSS